MESVVQFRKKNQRMKRNQWIIQVWFGLMLLYIFVSGNYLPFTLTAYIGLVWMSIGHYYLVRNREMKRCNGVLSKQQFGILFIFQLFTIVIIFGLTWYMLENKIFIEGPDGLRKQVKF